MSAVRRLRWYVLLEGISYLVLLCAAMPLKYVFGIPAAVRIAGSLHGLLFVMFVMTLYEAHIEGRWRRGFTLSLLGASLIPGSLVWLDRRLRRCSSDEKIYGTPPAELPRVE